MLVSLNELMMTCQKGATGAGAAQGAAEDLGHAAVWLALRGFSATEAALRATAAAHSGASEYGAFTVGEASFEWGVDTGGAALSAALVGGAAADLFWSLALAGGGCAARLRDVDVPLLQLAHFSMAAPAAASARFTWSQTAGDTEFRLVAGGMHRSGPVDVHPGDGRCLFEATTPLRGGARPDPSEQVVGEDQGLFLHGVAVDPASWRRLKYYADLTLVEPTARSRAQGAGAGVSDND